MTAPAATPPTAEPDATLAAPGGPPPDVLPALHVPGYAVLAELGRGGMGVIDRARHPGLDRVALKMVLAGDHAG